SNLVFMAQCFRFGGGVVHPLIGRYVLGGLWKISKLAESIQSQVFSGYLGSSMMKLVLKASDIFLPNTWELTAGANSIYSQNILKACYEVFKLKCYSI
ncbi:hypothetical protein ACRTEE_22635, partial [Vibrio alginolyticus]